MHLWFRIASLPDLLAVSSRRSASSERLRRQNVFAFVACAIRLARLSPCGPRTLPGAFLRNGPRNVHVFVAFPTHVIISKTMSYMLQQNCYLVHSNGPFISMASSIVMKHENVYVSKVRKHPFTCKNATASKAQATSSPNILAQPLVERADGRLHPTSRLRPGDMPFEIACLRRRVA